MSPVPVRDVVRECLRQYFKGLAEGLRDAPQEVRDDLTVEFQFHEAAIDPAPLNALEMLLPAPLPRSLHAYLTVGYFRGVEAFEYVIPGVSVPDPFSGVRPLLLHREFWPLGYMQFGYGPCGDPLLLDISAKQGGDFPVVAINHDLAPLEAWATRAAIESYAERLAPSFEVLLRGMCLASSGPPPWRAAA